MGRITWSMENNGDVVEINNTNPQDYFKEAGAHGMGVAATTVRVLEGASGGGKWRNTRRGLRDMVFPVIFFGETADEIELKMDRLLAIMDDTYTAPKLVATYPNGDSWEAPFHYIAGADSPIGTDSDGRHWARWPLSLQSPDSYWTSRQSVSYSIRAGSTGRGLVRTGAGGLSRLRISSSQALGTLSIDNPGHVDAYPIWTIKGPGDSLIVTRVIDGKSFTYEVPILGSETITIDTKAGTVVDQLGVSRYGSLAPAPKLFSIPRGESSISVLLTNATVDSLVSMYFLPRREFVFG